MSRFGVGPVWLVISVVYIACAKFLFFQNQEFFSIPVIPYGIIAVAGIVLLVIGVPFYMIAGITGMRAYNEGKLCTSGIYGLCRHPIYAAWVVFIVPGVMLLMNSWIGLTAIPVMYISLRMLVLKEELYMEEKFGDEYRAYKKKVFAIFPFFPKVATN